MNSALCMLLGSLPSCTGSPEEGIMSEAPCNQHLRRHRMEERITWITVNMC